MADPGYVVVTAEGETGTPPATLSTSWSPSKPLSGAER
jgi:hypothetical protein